MDSEQIVQLAPSQILADDNARYSLLKADIDILKSAILDHGSIHTPVEVEPLDTPVDGAEYRLTVGFRRYRAASELNSEKNAGLTIPAVIRSNASPVARLERQLSENIDRKSLSPMDTAAAIKKLLEAGVSRQAVRELFKRPGGRKGNKVQPASGSWLNMTLSFLELPKEIRDKIHSGVIGIAAAYELTKVSPERRETVLAKAEEEREAALDREEKEEAKYQETEAKFIDAQKMADDVTTDVEHAKAELELAEKALQEKQDVAARAAAAAKKIKDKAAKKVAAEAAKAALVDVKGAEKQLTTVEKGLDKLTTKQEKVKATAEELQARLETARKTSKANKEGKSKKAVSGTDIKQAAGGYVPLKLADVRKMFVDLKLMAESYPKVSAIAATLEECINGVTTTGQMLKKLTAITGEVREPRKS